MALIKAFIFCIILVIIRGKPHPQHNGIYSVVVENGKHKLMPGTVKGWAAIMNYTDNTFKDGWAYFEVKTNPEIDDNAQSFCAGFAEGMVTTDITYNAWRNTVEGFCDWKGEAFCKRLRNYLSINFKWMKKQIKKYQTTDPIWHHAALILSQLEGLHMGYTQYNKKGFIPFEDFVFNNLMGDIEDLDSALRPPSERMTFKEWLNSDLVKGNGHCSALIKVLPGNTDLYVSHVTWNTYQSMLRIQKKYEFNFRLTAADDSPLIPGRTVSFPSYPGLLHSGDDFYILSSGLVTMETTIGNSNPLLWVNVKPKNEILEWMRVIIANRIATNGDEWAKIFSKFNSGTYNNQWMVVDYNLFEFGKTIKNGTLTVLEQLPGYIQYDDMSHVLRQKTYWASYNVPSFKDVFYISGLPALVEKYGDWFSYDKTPRALIFERDHSKVTDLGTMIKLMRYNDFQHDPLSKCECNPPYSAENAISARSELNPKNGTYPFAALGHRNHGGTDVKVTSSNLRESFQFLAINGPTYEQQIPFKWSDQDFANDTPHYGHPDLWQFPVTKNHWSL